MKFTKMLKGAAIGIGAAAALPILGPAGILTAAGVAVGAGVGAAVGALGKDDEERSLSLETETSNDNTLSPKLLIGIASFIAHVDGMDTDEEKEILTLLDKEVSKDSDPEKYDELKKLITTPPTFSKLMKQLELVKGEDIKQLEKVMQNIAEADDEVSFEEKAALLKIGYYLINGKNITLYSIIEKGLPEPEGVVNDVLKPVLASDLESYSFTKEPRPKEIYIEHPYDNKLLISPNSLFLSKSNDKLAEILEGLRLVGAESIEILVNTKEMDVKDGHVGFKADVKTNIPFSSDNSEPKEYDSEKSDSSEGLDVNVSRSASTDRGYRESITITYSMPKKGMFSFLSKNRRSDEYDFMNNSTYLKDDVKLVGVFNSRLDSKGDCLNFDYELTEKTIAKSKFDLVASVNAVIPSTLNILSLDASAQAEFSKEKIVFSEYRLSVKFHAR